jgi:hypothetical protein
MPGPCQRIQDEVDTLEREIHDFGDALGDLPDKSRPVVLQQIARLRTQLRALRTQLQACQHDPNVYYLQLDGMEVCQSVQELGNAVPLVAGKKTIVRAYLSYYGAAPISVSATLQAQSPGHVASSIPSLDEVVLDPRQAGDTTFKRKNVAHSLNFVLPDVLTTPGALTMTVGSVTNTATHAMLHLAFNSATTVHFDADHPLRVRVLAVRYQQQVNPAPSPPTTFVASASDLQHLRSWLRRAYPVAAVIWSSGVVDARARTPFTSSDINAQLAAIRALDVTTGTDRRTHYYGLVSDGGFFMRGSAAGIPATPDPSVVAAGPAGPASWGWDFDGSYADWYAGHELGHTFGRLHPGNCRGESRDDTAYPYANGQLADSDSSFYGFDVGDAALGVPMAALPGNQWFDVMTYCNNEWLSDYTYEAIRTRLAAEDALPARALAGHVVATQLVGGGAPDDRYPEVSSGATGEALMERTLVSVVATIDLTSGQGRFEYVQAVPGSEPTPSDAYSPVVVRARRADGTLLSDNPVAVKLNSELGPGDARLGLVDAVLSLDGDARGLELVIHGRVVDTFGGSPTYAVQASTDGGRSWQTLAVGLSEPAVDVDPNQFPPGQTVMLRVITTDGFSRSEVSVEELHT